MAHSTGATPAPRCGSAILIFSTLGPPLLEAAEAETAVERALQHAEKEEDGERRQNGDRHLLGRRIAIVLAELRKAERISAPAIDRDDGERPEELVPAVAEGEDREHRDRGQDLRHDHLEEDARLARAVDTRRLDVVAW